MHNGTKMGRQPHVHAKQAPINSLQWGAVIFMLGIHEVVFIERVCCFGTRNLRLQCKEQVDKGS